MKKTKLIKNLTPIIGAGMIASAITPLCSCTTTSSESEEKQPKKPDVPEQGKLNFDAGPKDLVMNDISTPMCFTNDMDSIVDIAIHIGSSLLSGTHALQFQYRIGFKDSSKWITDWTDVDTTEPIELHPASIIQFRAGHLWECGLSTGTDDTERVTIQIGTDSTKSSTSKGVTIGGTIASMACYCTNVSNDIEWRRGATQITSSWEFNNLFAGSVNLLHVSSNFLPFKDIGEEYLCKGCYKEMFSGCSCLKECPALPATVLADQCYEGMFQNCTSITSSPYLPATSFPDGPDWQPENNTNAAPTLKYYRNMFYGCSSLSSVGLAYLGNFSDKYFENWLGGVDSKGKIFYNGCDTTRGNNAIPTYFEVVQEQNIIDQTITFELKQDDDKTSEIVSNIYKFRDYKDSTINEFLKWWEVVCQPTKSGNSADHFVSSTGEIIYLSDLSLSTTVSELYGMTKTTDGVLKTAFGYYPQEITDCCNLIMNEATSITPKLASGAELYYQKVESDGTLGDPVKFVDGTLANFSAQTQYKIYGKLGTTSESNYTNLVINGNARLAGTSLSMLRTTATEESTQPADLSSSNSFAFYNLFANSKGLKEISSSFLPAKTLQPMCYAQMFLSCENLTKTPDIPTDATTGNGCCYNMFKACSSLQTFGELPAVKTIAAPYNNTYGTFEGMFQNCTKLKTVAPTNGITQSAAPRLAFYNMFAGCEALETAPKMNILSATWEDEGDKKSPFACMFDGCTHMTSASNVTINIQKSGNDVSIGFAGFYAMFRNCKAMTQDGIPNITQNITYVAKYGMAYMFQGCKTIIYAPFNLLSIKDDDHQVNEYSFYYMFADCTSLIRPTQIHVCWHQYDYCYAYMYSGCSSLKIKKGGDVWGEQEPAAGNKWCIKLCNFTTDSGQKFVKGMFNGCNSSGFTGSPSKGGASWYRYDIGRFSYGWEE